MAELARSSAKIPLGGMTCDHCVATVENALLALDGVCVASADLATQSALVEFDPSLTGPAKMKQALAAVGYAMRAPIALVPEGAANAPQAATPVPAAPPSREAGPRLEEAMLSIDGMTCASCVRSVEQAAMRVQGAAKCDVNLTASSARIVFDSRRGTLDDFVRAIRDAGYGVDLANPTADSLEDAAVSTLLRRRLAVSAVLTVPLLVLAMSHGLLDFPGASWVQFALALPVVMYGGSTFYLAAWNAARHLRADMNTLIAVGTGAAFAYSVVALAAPSWVSVHGHAPVYFETAAAIITLVLAGRFLEARARRRTSNSLRKLVALQAGVVRVRRDAAEREVELADVAIGDEVVLRPGDRVPVDGTVIEGGGAVDESQITGESVPVDKRPGSRVVSGSLNRDGFIVFTAERVGSETALSRIIEFVRRAQGSKAPAARLADRIAAVFVPAILVAAMATFAAWMVAAQDEGSLQMALSNAVSVLIIACPCALGLATPAALAVGIGRAAEHGILIRDGEALESARRVDTVVFDKTGTLTLGRFTVTDIETFGQLAPHEVTAAAAAVERLSEHPLASAIAAAGDGSDAVVEGYRALPGAGASAVVNGQQWLLGKAELLREHGIDISAATTAINRLESEGKSLVLAAREGELAGAFALLDTIRPGSASAVASLRHRGVRAVMISGDNAAAATAIASKAGIDDVLAPVLPIEKSSAIEGLQARGRIVAMVGDGINDAPALAQADLGIAIGAGTDIAVEAAGIVLVRNRPRDVDRAIELAKRTQRTIVQNYCWAFGYNILGVPIAAGALYPWTGLLLSPIVASAAMALSSVSVLANSLRLNRALSHGGPDHE